MLCCQREQGLPALCVLLFSCTCSLQQVLEGHWLRLDIGTGTGTKGAEVNPRRIV